MIAYLEGKIIFKGEKSIILDVNGVGYKVFLSLKALHKIPQEDKELNPHTKRAPTPKFGGEGRGQPPTNNIGGGQIGAASSRYGVGVKIFCYLNVREKALDLYGFLTYQELEFFETLIDIRSIGPKAALEISSIAPMGKIKEAIETEDEQIVKELFQVGKKKAQILILELSRKIKAKPEEKSVSEDEAFQALINLGFPKKRVKEALSKIPKEITDPKKKTTAALKILGR